MPLLAGGFPLLDHSLAEHLYVWLLITALSGKSLSLSFKPQSHLVHLVVHSGSGGQTVINLDNREEESVFWRVRATQCVTALGITQSYSCNQATQVICEGCFWSPGAQTRRFFSLPHCPLSPTRVLESHTHPWYQIFVKSKDKHSSAATEVAVKYHILARMHYLELKWPYSVFLCFLFYSVAYLIIRLNWCVMCLRVWACNRRVAI